MSGLLSKVSTVAEDWTTTVLQAIHDSTAQYLTVRQTNALLTAVAVGGGALCLWKLLFSMPPNMPPGPRPLPLIGNMHNMGKDKFAFNNMIEMKKKYGDIYTIHFGPMRLVALNSHDAIKQAFLQLGTVTSHREYFPLADIFSNNKTGIIFTDDGPILRIQRKLVHQALRKFTAGGSIDRYLDSAFEAMCAELDKNPNFESEDLAYTVAYNILLSMCFGKKFSFDDPFFKEWIQQNRKLDKLFDDAGMWSLMPFLEYFPTETKRLVTEMMANINKYIQESIEEHKSAFDQDKLTDFTYHLLSVQREAENDPEEKGNAKLLRDVHYRSMLLDLFFAGTDTTRMTLVWVWHYLAAFPEVQRKAQEEVDSVAGRESPVTSQHRSQLPYCDAVLHEILRIRTVAPMGLFHKTTEDIKLGGYDIPKGTGLVSNTWVVHFDEQYWPDPHAFLPERWLDESGQYVYQDRGFVPFSMGRRSCVGESFVKTELLVLMAKLLQRFTLEPQPGHRVSVEHSDAMSVKPVDQRPIVAKRR